MMCLECYYETGSEDVMKIDRLIGILSILLQKEKVTAPELAERFDSVKIFSQIQFLPSGSR